MKSEGKKEEYKQTRRQEWEERRGKFEVGKIEKKIVNQRSY